MGTSTTSKVDFKSEYNTSSQTILRFRKFTKDISEIFCIHHYCTRCMATCTSQNYAHSQKYIQNKYLKTNENPTNSGFH